jgi:hypothetical protein
MRRVAVCNQCTPVRSGAAPPADLHLYNPHHSSKLILPGGVGGATGSNSPSHSHVGSIPARRTRPPSLVKLNSLPPPSLRLIRSIQRDRVRGRIGDRDIPELRRRWEEGSKS